MVAWNKGKGYKFQWANGATTKAIVKRLGFDADTEKYFAKRLLAYSAQYTPYDPTLKAPHLNHGLTSDGRINPNVLGIDATDKRAAITYKLPYARYQYFADDANWNRYTPNTAGLWLEHGWQFHKADIRKDVASYANSKHPK